MSQNNDIPSCQVLTSGFGARDGRYVDCQALKQGILGVKASIGEGPHGEILGYQNTDRILQI